MSLVDDAIELSIVDNCGAILAWMEQNINALRGLTLLDSGGVRSPALSSPAQYFQSISVAPLLLANAQHMARR